MAAYSPFFFHIPQIAPPAQLRSFLSLDIAESVRTVRSTESIEDLPRRSRTPTRPTPSRASSASSTSSSQRALPQPKPVPRSVIPAVPRRAARSQDAPRRAPRPAAPAPPLPSPAPVRPASIMTGTSAASTHYRYTKRTDALARLEGRVSQPRPISPPPYSPYAAVHRTKSAAPVLATKSFMPFSEEDSDSDEYDGDAEDVHVQLELDLGLDFDVDFITVPSSPDNNGPDPLQARPRAKKGRSRAGTIESWFAGPPPVPKNFMDFEDVDAPWDAKRGYL